MRKPQLRRGTKTFLKWSAGATALFGIVTGSNWYCAREDVCFPQEPMLSIHNTASFVARTFREDPPNIPITVPEDIPVRKPVVVAEPFYNGRCAPPTTTTTLTTTTNPYAAAPHRLVVRKSVGAALQIEFAPISAPAGS